MARIEADAVWEFADAIKQGMSTPSQKRQATVQSVDADGTVWVQVAGSEAVTPIATSNADVRPGDVVNVEQRGASLHVEGNITDPSVGERGVNRIVAPVRAKLTQAAEDADAAKLAAKAAQEAAEAASAANQHFWDDTNGAHVTEVDKDSWTDPQSADYHSGHNMLLNSLGLLFRKAMNNLASFTQSAVAFFDGTGNAASNVVASFTSDGAQIGKADKAHATITRTQFTLTNADGQTTSAIIGTLNDPDTGLVRLSEQWTAGYISAYGGYGCKLLSVNNLSYVSIVEVKLNRQVTTSYSNPEPNVVIVNGAAEGDDLIIEYDTDAEASRAQFSDGIASGLISFACNKGYAKGYASFAEGYTSHAVGNYSHAEGSGTYASGMDAHAEGASTTAEGECSHAEGIQTVASGLAAHAEGNATTAVALAHAEGDGTTASAPWAHAQNLGTIAAGAAQTAMGKYNVSDTHLALIIGNGTADNARSNAHTLDWSGNADFAGEVTAHSGSTAHNLTDKADQADLTALETTVAAIGATTGGDHASDVAVANQTWASITSVSLTKGTWVLSGGAFYPSNATGRRYVAISTSASSITSELQRATQNTLPAISSSNIYLHTTHIVKVSSTTAYYLLGWQNSGGSMNCRGSLTAVKVSG